MKIMVFTEGTVLTHEDWRGLSREEIVRRVKQGRPLRDFARSIPIGDAVAKLSDKVRKGGAGVWGPIPMPPNAADKINDADLKSTVEWILKG